MQTFFVWLESTAYSMWLRDSESIFAFPMILTVHTASMALLAGISAGANCWFQECVTDAWADARFWAEAINMGAYDLLAQPFHKTEVRRVLSGAGSRQPETKAGVAAL